MFVWWQYTLTFVGSLIVALGSVWFAQWLSARREYRKALETLRSEVSANINNACLMIVWIDTNLDKLKEGNVAVATCPHLYESAWISTRGAVSSKDYDIATKMEAAYGFLVVINDLMRAVEELKWRAGATMASSSVQQAITVFTTMKAIINESLLPRLREAKILLDERLD